MTTLRERVKRSVPPVVYSAVNLIRKTLEAPPLEESVLHAYFPSKDDVDGLRLNFVVPSLSPDLFFGGVPTALDIFFDCARRLDAHCRIVLDHFNHPVDQASVDKLARRAGIEPSSVEICPRTAEVQPIALSKNDVFFAYSWWTTLNVSDLTDQQQDLFGGKKRPVIYIAQDYEPGFYGFSSTHLFARAAFDLGDNAWGVFNSTQLHDYIRTQGHSFGREYVFEPKAPASLRNYLALGPAPKEKRILVYGRPGIPRNCYSALLRGLRAWTSTYPEFADWTVVSAGLRHPREPIGGGRFLESLGKLPLDDYASLLRTTAVGVSLMASPHPSYPPLEMAHFGVITVTNGYTCKNLTAAHDNIITLRDITPKRIAEALAEACRGFDRSPQAGWAAQSHMPNYLDEQPYPFLEHLAADIAGMVQDAAA